MFDHQSRCAGHGGENTRRFPRSRAAGTRRQGHDGLAEFRLDFLIGSPPRLRADGHVQKNCCCGSLRQRRSPLASHWHSKQPEEVCCAPRPPGPLCPTTTHMLRTEKRTISPAFRPLLLAERSLHRVATCGLLRPQRARRAAGGVAPRAVEAPVGYMRALIGELACRFIQQGERPAGTRRNAISG